MADKKMQEKTKQHALTSKKTHTKTTAGKKGGMAGMAPVATGATIGAVAGGLMGAAAGAVMKDEKTRVKVGEVFENVKDYALDAASKAQETVKETATDATDTAQKSFKQNVSKKIN